MNKVNNSDASANKEKGASLVEYALLVALIAVVAISAVGTLGTNVKGQYSVISNKIQ